MEPSEITAIETKPSGARIFVPADLGRDFGASFLDEAKCRNWIITMIYGDGAASCPECRAELEGKALLRFWEGRRICCRSCGKYFTALTGTFLAGCHLTFTEVVLLAVFLYFSIPPREVARILRISQETVRLWEIKFQALQKLRRIETGA